MPDVPAARPRWRRSSRTALLAGAAVVLLLAVVFAERVSRKMPDLEVYWTAAVRARAAEPLYRVEDQHYQFKYLPAFAVLAIPIGWLPLAAAKGVWFATSALLLVALVASSVSLLPERRKPLVLLAVVTILAMAKFFGHELVLGQMNLLLAVVVVLALTALRTGRHEAAAGALLALAVVVKPYAIIFVPWLLARRRTASIAAVSIGLVAALALPAVIYGVGGDVELHRAWWRTVTESTAPNLTNADNVSIAAMYAKWIEPGRTAAVLAICTNVMLLSVAAVMFARRRRVPFPEGLEGALLLTLIPLLSPQGWDYVLLVSTPAVVFLVNYEDRLPRVLRALSIAALATVAFSLYDVMGRRAYAAFMAMSIVSVCYVVLVAALGSLRARAAA